MVEKIRFGFFGFGAGGVFCFVFTYLMERMNRDGQRRWGIRVNAGHLMPTAM